MFNVFRRVLLVLVLLTIALSWLSRPADVYAQNDAANTAVPQSPTGLTVPTNGLIAVIEIDGAILYQNQFDSVKRRVDRAINDGADLIVFDLNTPGGDMMLGIELSKYIRTLPVPTVAWVNDRAISAGVLIASACDEIVMAKASMTGDCGPILMGRNMAPSERAKALSILLAEFRTNAQDNYSGTTTDDYALFNAMCVLGIDVYEVRHKITGEVRLVSQSDYTVMVDGTSPIDAAKLGPSAAGSALVDPDSGEDLGKPTVSVTPAEMGQWAFVRQIHNGTSFVTLNDSEALDIGLARDRVSGTRELQQLYGAGQVKRYNETWSESLVGFLVHPVVRAALVLLGIVGLLMEYLSPGLILPGVIGLIAMVTAIGAPFLVGLAETWHLVLIVIGAGLVVYELLTMTTFGVLAILGLLMFLAGMVLSGVQSAANGLPAPGAGRQIVLTAMAFMGAAILSIPALFILTRYFGQLPVLNKLVLNETLSATRDFTKPHQSVTGKGAGGVTQALAPGTLGKVSSTGLRPAGRIEVGDQLIDVTSTGGFIEPGTAVRVVEVQGNMISVEPADQPADDS